MANNIYTRFKALFSQPFIGSSGIYGIGTDSTRFFTKTPLQFYNEVPELRAIVSQQSEMFVKPVFTILGADGKPAKDIETLLNNPNPFQTRSEFLSNLYLIYALYDNVWIYIDNKGLGYINKQSQMFCFSASDLDIREKQINATPLKWSDSISEIWATVPWTSRKLKLELENLHFINRAGVSISEILTGTSRVSSLEKPLSNLLISYETENKVLKQRGPNAIVSPEISKDGYGGMIMGTDKAEIEEKFSNKYGGLDGQNRFLVAMQAVKITPLSWNMNDLGINDTRLRNKIAVCSVMGHDILLLNETTGSTYANLSGAQAGIYENTILPAVNTVATFFASLVNGSFEVDTSGVESLRQDDKMLAETNNTNANIVINLNKSVKAGEMTKENAVFVLIGFGIAEEDANKVINEYKAPTNGTDNKI